MKQMYFSIIILVMMLMGTTLPVQGQTYAYRLTKVVSEDGEVREGSGRKVFVTFTNDKGTFYISKRDGERAGRGDASTGYASGFNNQKIVISSSGYLIDNTGFSRGEVRDPQDFQYTGTQGDIHVYKNKRPLLVLDRISHNIYIRDYTLDYAKFNADYSRINFIPSFETGDYGLIPFGISKGDKAWKTFVFEQVKEANAPDGVFY